MTVSSMDEYTKRAIRASWNDGLWDLTMAVFFVLFGMYWYMPTRLVAFAPSTWPWPFAALGAAEETGSSSWPILVWGLALVPLVLLWKWGMHRVVGWLRARLTALRSGEVHHRMWQSIDRKVLVMYAGLFIVLTALLIWLLVLTGQGPHAMSAGTVVAPAAILFAIGHVYRIARYRMVAAAGLMLGAALDLFATTPVTHGGGPDHFLHVSPMFGNPAVPLFGWAVVLSIGGVIALYRSMGRRDEQ